MPEFEVVSIRRWRKMLRLGDDRGWTFLHIYARKGDLKEVKPLLNEGMHVNVAAWGPNSHGVTPLHLAAEGGHVKVMDELISTLGLRVHVPCGWTPLHIVAKERKKEAIRFLVENRAFLPDNINNTRFNPPIHYCPNLEWAYQEMMRLQQDYSY